MAVLNFLRPLTIRPKDSLFFVRELKFSIAPCEDGFYTERPCKQRANNLIY